MVSLAESLRRLTVSVASPHRMVTVTLAGARARVELRGGAADRVTESALAAEVTAAWSGALAERQAARARIRDEYRGAEIRPPRPQMVRRLLERRAAVEAVSVAAQSASGDVRAAREGSVRGRVAIRPGTLRGLSARQAAAELESAIRAAEVAHRQARLAVRRRERETPAPVRSD